MQIQNNSTPKKIAIGASGAAICAGGIGAYKFINNKDRFEKTPVADITTIKNHETIAKLAQDCSEYDGLGNIDGFSSRTDY